MSLPPYTKLLQSLTKIQNGLEPESRNALQAAIDYIKTTKTSYENFVLSRLKKSRQQR